MKDRPIIFSGPMVRPLLDGCKTQTRRAMKNPAAVMGFRHWLGRQWERLSSTGQRLDLINCPYGEPGDRLWVKETYTDLGTKHRRRLVYRADVADSERVRVDAPWRSSLFMPRRASRILLEIGAVRVERLQDISNSDAVSEGITGQFGNYKDYSGQVNGFALAADSYRTLWESLNGAGSWDANPWVWVIEFKRITVHECAA